MAGGFDLAALATGSLRHANESLCRCIFNGARALISVHLEVFVTPIISRIDHRASTLHVMPSAGPLVMPVQSLMPHRIRTRPATVVIAFSVRGPDGTAVATEVDPVVAPIVFAAAPSDIPSATQRA